MRSPLVCSYSMSHGLREAVTVVVVTSAKLLPCVQLPVSVQPLKQTYESRLPLLSIVTITLFDDVGLNSILTVLSVVSAAVRETALLHEPPPPADGIHSRYIGVEPSM